MIILSGAVAVALCTWVFTLVAGPTGFLKSEVSTLVVGSLLSWLWDRLGRSSKVSFPYNMHADPFPAWLSFLSF